MTPHLTLDDFSADIGKDYRADLDGEPVSLTLESASPIGHSARQGGSFNLGFRGPPEPLLPQATYSLDRDGRLLDIFLVPIARDEAGAQYEAVFN